MRYYFGGSEIKSWRDLLIAQQVPTVSLSYIGLGRRYKKATVNWKISAHYAEFQRVFLDSGAYTLNREDASYTKEEAAALLNDYVSFAVANIDSLEMVSELDAQIFGHKAIKDYRMSLYDEIPPEKFMPIWHAEYGTDELESLCSQYEVVGVLQPNIRDDTLTPVFNRMVNRYGIRLHGVAITSKEAMKRVAFDSVSSMSWLSPSVYGDTIIWSGKELKRYPKAYKSARLRYRTWFNDNGFDSEKIENDDPQELLKLSLWSWQQFTGSITPAKTDRVTMTPQEQNSDFADIDPDVVDNQGGNERNEKLLPVVRERRETTVIPVMGIKFGGTEDEEEEVPFVFKRSESMRVCNTCFLREKCPGFKKDANCLYNIPIEVKTKDQLRAVQEALIEMQTQRVLFMQMAEDLEGGYADPNLSSEMDRLNRMIKAKQDSEKDMFTLTQTITGSSNKPGFFAETFGTGAAGKVRELEQPILADDILEGEIVGEGK